jgi:hypothetical protein
MGGLSGVSSCCSQFCGLLTEGGPTEGPLVVENVNYETRIKNCFVVNKCMFYQSAKLNFLYVKAVFDCLYK